MQGSLLNAFFDLVSNAPVAVTTTNPLPVSVIAGPGGLGPVWGPDANGAVITKPAVQVGGVTSGGAIQPISVDAAGHQNVQGSTVNGSAIGAQGGIILAAYDGANVRFLQSDANGTLKVAGNQVPGVSAATTNLVIGGHDGTFNRAIFTDTRGAIISKPYAPASTELQNTQNIAAAGTTVVFAAAGAGLKNFMTAIQLDSVLASVATLVQVKDGATVIWSKNIPAGVSSVDITFPTPLQGTANTAMNVTTSTAGPVNLNAQGYKG